MSGANPLLLSYLDTLRVLRSELGVAWFCFALSIVTTVAR
jgi:hypothetical protein